MTSLQSSMEFMPSGISTAIISRLLTVNTGANSVDEGHAPTQQPSLAMCHHHSPKLPFCPGLALYPSVL